MNKCFLIGNLTRDPELRTTSGSGLSVCSFTLAVTRNFSNRNGEREADFIPIVVWRNTAENCAKYLRKGSQVAVSGAIQTRTYDGNDGQKRYVTEVVADEVQFLNRIAGREDGNISNNGFESSIPPAPSHSSSSLTDSSGTIEIDDELPF